MPTYRLVQTRQAEKGLAKLPRGLQEKVAAFTAPRFSENQPILESALRDSIDDWHYHLTQPSRYAMLTRGGLT